MVNNFLTSQMYTFTVQTIGLLVILHLFCILSLNHFQNVSMTTTDGHPIVPESMHP